jgi:hypothetical protein
MILYHGSNQEVKEPKIIVSNKALDFGSGFYTTSDMEQASKWAKTKTRRLEFGSPIVSVFEYDENKSKQLLKTKFFKEANLDWLDFVTKNRKNNYTGEWYDVVIGPVADDYTILTINDYISGVINAETAVILLKPRVFTDQYVFLTKKALSTLTFLKGINVDG